MQRPAKLVTNPVHMITTPQAKTIVPMNTDGRLNLSRIMLLGISAAGSVVFYICESVCLTS